jgi:hypothetical protein
MIQSLSCVSHSGSHIEIVEYIRGITFREAEPHGKKVFEDPLTFQKLGSVIVFDILLNNWDRGILSFTCGLIL